MKSLKGLNIVIQNLNKSLEGIRLQTAKGLTDAAIHVLNDTEKTSPLTPVDEGNLQASRFIRSNASEDTYVGTKGNMKKGVVPNFSGKYANDRLREFNNTISEVSAMLRTSKNPKVGLGFTAEYSGIVHENVDPETRWKRADSGPKFLEAALKRNIKKIFDIVKREANIDQVVKEMRI